MNLRLKPLPTKPWHASPATIGCEYYFRLRRHLLGSTVAGCIVALFAAVVGGLAGYGTGALMPLVLVPLIGAEPVVPIIAISSIFTNTSRFAAYLRYADRRRALIVVAAAALTTAHTRLNNAGAAQGGAA